MYVCKAFLWKELDTVYVCKAFLWKELDTVCIDLTC